jgi:porin
MRLPEVFGAKYPNLADCGQIITSKRARFNAALVRPLSLCAALGLMTFGVAAVAQAADSPAPAAETVQVAETDTPSGNRVPVDQIPAHTPPAKARTCKDLDDLGGIRAWIIPFPSVCNTLVQDNWELRSKLADVGVGFLVLNASIFSSNLLAESSAVRGTNRQYFGGQRATGRSNTSLWITYNLDKIGIHDGQLVVGGTLVRDTWQPQGPVSMPVNALYWYQGWWDRRIETKLGYVSAGYEFLGTQLGGSLAGGANSVSASIQNALGLSTGATATPTIEVIGHISKDWYNRAALVRGTDAAGTVADVTYNKYSLFTEIPGRQDGAYYMDEIGYRHAASKGSLSTWVRGGF